MDLRLLLQQGICATTVACTSKYPFKCFEQPFSKLLTHFIAAPNPSEVLPNCERCLLPLTANPSNVLFGHKVFHRDCFRCCVCSKQLGTHFKHHGGLGPFCEEDFAELQASSILDGL